MRWLKELKNYNISFHISVLRKQDSVFIRNALNDYQRIYILSGIIQVLKVFTNNEYVCIELISTNQAINCKKFSNSQQHNYYYLLTAIKTTTIITIPAQELRVKAIKEVTSLPISELQIYHNRYEMTSIMSHRSTKKRVIQLLIELIEQFGRIKNHDIVIPFHLSHQTIAIITGSQRITISRIMNRLKQDGTINYTSKSMTVYSMIQLITI